jgi:hypothetical protein
MLIVQKKYSLPFYKPKTFTLPAGATMQLANSVNLTIKLYQGKAAYDTTDGALRADYKATGAGNSHADHFRPK